MKNDGGPAFPQSPNKFKCLTPDGGVASMECGTESNGMSLRDWFAGMALQGLISDSEMNAETHKEYAASAYFFADAMLKQRDL